MYIWKLMQRFIKALDGISDDNKTSDDTIDYCNRFLELMVDIEVGAPHNATPAAVHSIFFFTARIDVMFI
jgi:hypothetical protein